MVASHAETVSTEKRTDAGLSEGVCIDLMCMETAKSEYIVSIRRIFNGDFEQKLIDDAEFICPSRNDILAAMTPEERKSLSEKLDKCLWWMSEFDEVKIPFAVTGQAVSYYRNRIEFYRKGREATRSSMTYSARVERQTIYSDGKRVYRNVFVVTLRLKWSEYRGPLDAMGFERERIVVFSPDGQVLEVRGDGAGLGRDTVS